jgi:hypothetical protein
MGLGVTFEPLNDLCERLREHTQSWPMWTGPRWTPLRMADPAWPDLLRAAGRQQRR